MVNREKYHPKTKNNPENKIAVINTRTGEKMVFNSGDDVIKYMIKCGEEAGVDTTQLKKLL